MTGPDDGIQPLHQWRPALPPAPKPESLTCPECGGREFELFLGGPRHSGQVACAGCGLMFDRPEPEARP